MKKYKIGNHFIKAESATHALKLHKMFDSTKLNNSVKDEDIDQLSIEEQKAIEDYRKAIQGTTNPKLLELYAHILKEEVEHLEELQSAKSGEFEDSDEEFIEDDRLSPMTYKKLKEAGVSSEQWKEWSQEEANEYLRNKHEKGEEKKQEKTTPSKVITKEKQEKLLNSLISEYEKNTGSKLNTERVSSYETKQSASADVKFKSKEDARKFYAAMKNKGYNNVYFQPLNNLVQIVTRFDPPDNKYAKEIRSTLKELGFDEQQAVQDEGSTVELEFSNPMIGNKELRAIIKNLKSKGFNAYNKGNRLLILKNKNGEFEDSVKDFALFKPAESKTIVAFNNLYSEKDFEQRLKVFTDVNSTDVRKILTSQTAVKAMFDELINDAAVDLKDPSIPKDKTIAHYRKYKDIAKKYLMTKGLADERRQLISHFIIVLSDKGI